MSVAPPLMAEAVLRATTASAPWGRLCVRVARPAVTAPPAGVPPLLAVHGLGGSGRYWEGLARDAAAAGHLVVAPDLGGFGDSDRPRLRYSLDFHLDALDLALDAAGIDGAPLVVGQSLGGIIAAAWAARNPARVSGLALVATPFPAVDAESRANLLRTPLYRLLERSGPAACAAFFGAGSLVGLGAGLLHRHPLPRAVLGDFMRHSVRSFAGTAREVLFDPSLAADVTALSRTSLALLLLYGRHDRGVPASHALRWRRELGRGEPLVLDGGHHLVLGRGRAALTGWIASLPRPA